MLRLESDLFAVADAAARGRLDTVDVRWSPEPAVCVVMTPGGYPGEYETGNVITGIESVDSDVQVFQAGTKLAGGRLVTSGGRTLVISARAPTIREARARVYDNIRRISFKDAHYRTDIALEAE